MNRPQDTALTQSLPLPTACVDRTVLIMLRRMGAHGLRDSQAALLAMRFFGKNFRQPLVLLRCFVAEVAQASDRSILLSPCCARRITRDEALILETLAICDQRAERASGNLQIVTDHGTVDRALTVAKALNNALRNSGHVLEG